MSEPPHIPEELIELKAHQIWEQRQLDGREGTPQSDWEEAKQYLEKNRWKVRQWKFFRGITLRWEATLLENCLESIEFLLQKLAFFTILGRLGELTLIVAVVAFVFGEDVRRNNEVFAAWTTITTAHEQSGSGGRIRALEFLNSRPLRFPWIWGTIDLFWDGKECKRKLVFGRRWKREPLAGLSAPGAYLLGVRLCDANLGEANLQEADLGKANLQEADLGKANLQEANLGGANLQEANLGEANLQDANLGGANLQEANLGGANLQLGEADLMAGNLAKAILQDADLWGANFQLGGANLQNAFLFRANLQDALLLGANLQDAYLEGANLTNEQIKLTCFWRGAIYKGEWNEEKKTYVAIEPNNTNFIEELKNDTASDPPIETPDCSIWENPK